MEMLIVLIVVLALFTALGLVIRRHRRMLPDEAKHPEQTQHAESWLTKGGGRG
jgi:hypothetical protein